MAEEQKIFQQMSCGHEVPQDEIIDHYDDAAEPTTEEQEARQHKLTTGAFTAAGLGLAIFGGVTAYRHLKDK